jgi:hypothetical protein
VQDFPYPTLEEYVDSLVLVSHLSHLEFCLSVEYHRVRNPTPVSRGPCPDYVPYRASASLIVVSGQFDLEDRPEDRGPLAHWELAIEVLWEGQEKLHCSMSSHCDSRMSQVECGRTAAQEKSTVGFRDLAICQRLAAEGLLGPGTNQLLTVLSQNWLDQS